MMIIKILLDNLYSLILYSRDEKSLKKVKITIPSNLRAGYYQNDKLQGFYNHSDKKELEFIVLDPDGKRNEIALYTKLENPKYLCNKTGLKEKKPKKNKSKPVVILSKPDLFGIEHMSQEELNVVSEYFIRKGYSALDSKEKQEWALISKRLDSFRLFDREHYQRLQIESILSGFREKRV